MQYRTLFIACCVVGLAAALPVLAHAKALPGSPQQTPTPVGQPGGTGGIFLDTLSNVAGPNIAVDRQGGIHMAFEPRSGWHGGSGMPVQYGYCESNCLRDESWQFVRVGEAGLEGSATRLVLTAQGKPRLMWFRQDDWREPGVYMYSACESDCLRPANWRSVAVASDSVGPGEGRYFALDVAGNPHFLYTTTLEDHTGTYYSYCAGSCLSAANWYELQVSDNFLLGAFSLAFDAGNRLHVALSAEENNLTALVYLSCAGACGTPGNWTATALAPLGSTFDFSLRLDAQGHPRLAVFTGELDDSSVANRLFYLWCDAQCADAASWQGVDVGLAEEEGGYVDLIMDSQGHPHLALTTSTYLPSELDHVYCSANCDSEPVWQRETIEDAEGVAAAACRNGFWYVGKQPALAWSLSGSLLVAHGIEGECPGDTTNMHLARLVEVR